MRIDSTEFSKVLFTKSMKMFSFHDTNAVEWIISDRSHPFRNKKLNDI